jgi:hypothetical protein
MFTVTDSSTIAALGYDGTTRELRVTFKGSVKKPEQTTYAFAPVPPELVGLFFGAESLGAFFQRGIRPRFQGNKLAPGAAPPAVSDGASSSAPPMGDDGENLPAG